MHSQQKPSSSYFLLLFSLSFFFLLSQALLKGAESIPHSSTHSFRIGVIDMNRLFTSYAKTERSKKDYDSHLEELKKEVSSRTDQLKSKIDRINKLQEELQKGHLSEEVAKQKKEDLEKATTEARNDDQALVEYRSTQEKALNEKSIQIRKEIITEITQIINERATTLGYDLILDKSSPSAISVPMVLYSKPEYDITQEVVEILNKKDEEDQKKETAEKQPELKLE